ncbi:uncharacterized protein EDB93DRAFT_775573 [Suillus bovinus]|uniref:uncharacterized protein n=1 Tax=Suillus bovinus TaxID=48563 RepID=UPI001B86FCCD|nr:uncharacterized protein EDB93DRAFT_775573 [Suillus bovinus]KAG2136582.1 hypothetical protein EDB93DRAFT_775573 [Suillus bovinus]
MPAESHMRMHSKNVIIIGPSGAGKSSLINMLSSEANARTSGDTIGCTQSEGVYTCLLLGGKSCQVHDTIGLEGGRWGFLPARRAEKRLKTYLKRSREPWHLLVYCMPGSRGLSKPHARNYKKFKSVADKLAVPVVVVVTNLEDFKGPMENWWWENLDILERLGIPATTEHACITALPKDELKNGGQLHDDSCQAVKTLIRNIIWPSSDRAIGDRPISDRPIGDRSNSVNPSLDFDDVDELSSGFFDDMPADVVNDSSANELLARLSSLHRSRPKNGEATELPQPSRLSASHSHSLITRLSSFIHRSSPENDVSDELQQSSTPSLLDPHVLLARLSSFLPRPRLGTNEEAESHPTMSP